MKRDIVEHWSNILLFQIIDESRPRVQVFQQDEVHVGIVTAVLRDNGAFEAARLFQRLQQTMVFVPDRKTFFRNLVRFLQLSIQERGNHFTGQITGTDVNPCIFIDHAAVELAAVRAFFPNNLSSFEELFIIDDKGSPLAGDKILGLMETVAAQVSDRSQILSLVCGANPLSRILHDHEIMPFRYIHDHGHIAADTGIMNGDDCFRFRGNRLFDE